MKARNLGIPGDREVGLRQSSNRAGLLFAAGSKQPKSLFLVAEREERLPHLFGGDQLL
jgi:hypothetical protein